ncbi:SRR1-domain-containing protein [Boletus edulis]|uniref:SRR1-domain-containing protein n=1 Tax=Boletus edulis BED1 TaxID=1328754 RepID=A0AAD4GJT0_BOLED|nr:SRR1-domain-containing protein [Boletus edulis]KAF8447926.1 SRR1-domain-containing protein [Boletus edulis BED1]
MEGSDSNVFAYDSFIRVNPRKKRKRKDKGNATTPCDLLIRVTEELKTDRGGWFLCCEEICREALDEARMAPRKVLCLGLGSPSSSRDARAQLALLSCLCASLGIVSADVSMYDPVFTDADRQLFQTLGMRYLDHNQGTEHSLNCPTILYMPHCDLRVYEQVIRANWTLEGLCNIVFLANRFRDYVDHNAVSKLEKESPCMLKLEPFVESRPIPTSSAFPSAFTSLAVQYVSRTPLSLQGDAFWELPLLD